MSKISGFLFAPIKSKETAP